MTGLFVGKRGRQRRRRKRTRRRVIRVHSRTAVGPWAWKSPAPKVDPSLTPLGSSSLQCHLNCCSHSGKWEWVNAFLGEGHIKKPRTNVNLQLIAADPGDTTTYVTFRKMDGRVITSAEWCQLILSPASALIPSVLSALHRWKQGLDHLRSHCCGQSRWDSQTVLVVTGSHHTPERSGRDSEKTQHACFSLAASLESSSGSPEEKDPEKEGGEKFRGLYTKRPPGCKAVPPGYDPGWSVSGLTFRSDTSL